MPDSPATSVSGSGKAGPISSSGGGGGGGPPTNAGGPKGNRGGSQQQQGSGQGAQEQRGGFHDKYDLCDVIGEFCFGKMRAVDAGDTHLRTHVEPAKSTPIFRCAHAATDPACLPVCLRPVTGVGSTSTVHRCVERATGKEFACKIIDKR